MKNAPQSLAHVQGISKNLRSIFLKKFGISVRYSLLFYRKNEMNIWLYVGLIVILQKNQNSMVRKIIVEM